jgi:hypothetical protein
VKAFLKSIASRVAPTRFQELSARRARARNQRLEVEWGCVAVAEKILARSGPVVQTGPFAGLQFPARTHSRHIGPKLIGSYEEELYPILEALLDRPYRAVVDVGCAEGYYAVGLAMRLPRATVHAFDTDAWARQTVAEMAELNGVQNLRIHGACDPEWLASNLEPDTFVLSDCEGYEDVLLDPLRAPTLEGADILVELHEAQAPGVGQRIAKRFQTTHEAQFIGARDRDPEQYPAIDFLEPRERQIAVSDIRPEDQQWLLLVRKQNSPRSST